MESGRTVQTTEDVVFYIYLDGLTLAVVSNYTAGNMGNKKFIKKKTFAAYILKARIAGFIIPQKNLNFPQISSNMPQNGPKMVKNDPNMTPNGIYA